MSSSLSCSARIVARTSAASNLRVLSRLSTISSLSRTFSAIATDSPASTTPEGQGDSTKLAESGTGAEPMPTRRRRPTRFADVLNAGPSFDDFLRQGATKDDVITPDQRRKKEIVRLPTWLKTDIPMGTNYTKIKEDLRGLNLHTGMSFYSK